MAIPAPLTPGSYAPILPCHLGSRSAFESGSSSGETSCVLTVRKLAAVLKICITIRFSGSRNHGSPVRQLAPSVTSGRIRFGLSGSSQPLGRNVPYTVSLPERLMSMVYWPAARSPWMREASCDELPARYSRSMPKRCLKASGILVDAPGSGGPLTTTLPSFFAAATSASQPEAEGAAGAAVGLAGAGLVLHAAAA